MRIWVIGHNGLLGSAIVRTALTPVFTIDIQWEDSTLTRNALREAFEQFVAWAGAEPWAICWAAGTAVPATNPAEFAAQEAVLLDFARFIAGQCAALAATPGATLGAHGVFWFASSASIYGTSRDIVWSEFDTPHPVGPYPESKYRLETELAKIFSAPTSPSLVIGRITTLYGPGQNLAKPQGLITKMCYEAITRGSVTLSVPLETLRDYLYVDDAGNQIHASINSAFRQQKHHQIDIIANGTPTSVAELVRLIPGVTHRRVHVLQLPPSANSVHATVLLAASHNPDLAALPRVSLIDGVQRVVADIRQRTLAGLG